MSNYNNKNAVWGNKPPINQNNSMQPQLGGLGNLNHSGMVPFQQVQQQQVFQNMGLNQQNLGLGLQQIAATQLNASLASNPIFQQQLSAVSYPNPRGLNPTAFQTSAVNNLQNSSASGTKQRVFTGTVTQIHDNFGFIDDEVFFPRNVVVKGSNPMVGDRVLVEAAFNASMPFKWNATRVHKVLQSNQQQPRDSRGGGRDHSSGYNAVPPPSISDSGNGFGRRADFGRDPSRDRPKATVGERRVRSRDRDDDEVDRKRRREERMREREKEDKDRKSPVRRRSRSPKARRRARIVPRYMVQIPKIALDLMQADVLEVKRRYSNLYIPSDFFNTYIRWVDAFPPNKPYTLNKPCSFHIMYKELDSVNENDAVLEPSDADYRFSAKVMLMSVPGIEEIYQKCCSMAEDKDKRDRDSEERDFVHPTRLVNFLVGLRGKNETMAIGGPWSPSLDGENPEKDPSVLIKTAIRSCKALTGIDLSNCTQWYRFVELYYRRSESTHKGKLVPARVETVVLFLPDVWSCLPTRLEWEDLQQSYRKHLEKILKASGGDEKAKSTEENDDDDEKEEGAPEKLKPTHYSLLDAKSMVVADLRDELKARNLVSTGLKSQLVARLTKALKAEAEKDDEESEEKDKEEREETAEVEERQEEGDKKSETDEKKLDEQQRRRLEKQYTLPDQPHLIVHPSKMAKSGKFDCTTMSLSLLLDYRPEDTKEHSFEVSLFAELFNEMLMRDFGFNIFKALHELPEKPKEKEDDKKKKEDKRDEKKDDKKSDDKRKDRKDDDKREDKSAERDKKSEESETKKDRDDDDKKRDRDSKRDERRSDSSEDEDDDDDKRDKKDKDKKKKDRVKLYTKNKHLLLSFVYFDQTHCGYIFDKDVEELLCTLGLNLSRSQVKKLVNKVITRDSLHYRKLTDKPKDEDKEKIENGDKPGEKVIDLKELALGNKRLLPIFDGGKTISKTAKKNDGGNSTSSDGLVVYQGAVVDIGKLLSQLERSEKARIETEQLMVDVKNENHRISEKYAKSSSTIKHLTSEVKEYKEKLRSTEDTLGRTNAHAKLFQTTLMDIRDKIEPILKTVSHKDKEDRKDRDRDSDKKKEKDDSKSRWEKERDSSKKESDKEKEIKKEHDVKKDQKDKENKEESKKEKEESKRDAEKKVTEVKHETESQDSDVEMKEDKNNF